MDNCRDTDNSVGVGTGQQLHDGRVHSYPAGTCCYCCAAQPLSGAAAWVAFWKGQTGDIGLAPNRHFTVAVLTNYIGMNIVGVDPAMSAEQESEARRIQSGPRSNDPSHGITGNFEGNIRQDIDGIGYDQQSSRFVRRDLGNDIFGNIRVLANEIQPGLTLLLSGARGNDNNVGALAVRVVSCEDSCRLDKGQA